MCAHGFSPGLIICIYVYILPGPGYFNCKCIASQTCTEAHYTYIYRFYIFIHADQTTHSTVVTRIDVGIAIVAIVATGIITLVIGVLTGVLVYHCISKHRSHSSSSHQQHQGPQYEEVPVTVRMDKIEVKDNIAYGPVMH